MSKLQFTDGDLLIGNRAIQIFLGGDLEKIKYLVKSGALPCWRVGRTVMATKSRLREWLAEHEAAASRIEGA